MKASQQMKEEVAVEGTNKFAKPLTYFAFGSISLLVLYLLLMRLTTGSMEIAVSQFRYYSFWIIALSIGFGVQLFLFKYLKELHIASVGTEKMAKVTGTTSTTTMVACCAHHAVDVLPIVGASALASFLGAYTTELFAIGLVFNLFGIAYMLRQLQGFNYGKI